jgi:eukaryotic-like serine/threonine-protein kinase
MPEDQSQSNDPRSLFSIGGPGQGDSSSRRYRILQRVGSGGMGEVYEAEQLEPIRRRVALKVIKRGMDTDAVVARFESERQALALMDHASIARVYDAGATPDGRPYFVMEYVSGIPITDYCDQNRLGLRERLGLFIRICEGVQHAHQKGIIHRDIKPTNVLVTVHGDQPAPKIIDFGLAKATAHILTERTLYTELGQLVGTPEYMSPEQAEMSGLDVDTRTDIYSLGVLLYELLVGTLPFDPEALRAGSYDDMRWRIREEEAPRPSTRAEQGPRRGRPELALPKQLRGDLDWIVMKAIEKDRTRRYASASDLAADIHRHLNDEPVMAGPPSQSYRMKKFVRRHKLAVAAASAVTLALLLGIVGTTVGLVRAKRAERAAEQISDFLVGLFKVADPESTLGNRITAREILDRGAERIDHELKDQPLLRARLLGTMGDVYKNLGLYSAARPLLESSLALRRDRLGESHLDVSDAEARLGELYRLAGNRAGAESLLTRALATREKALGPRSPEVGAILCDLGMVYAAQGKFDKASPVLERSLAIREKALGPEHADVARSLNELGVLRWRQERYSAAESLFRRAIPIWEKSRGSNHPDVARSLNNLALVLREEGRSGSTIPLYRRALAIYEKALGPDHPRVAAVLSNLAQSLSDQGDYAAAIQLCERALTIKEKALGPEHPDVAATLQILAYSFKEQRKYDAAFPLLNRALAIREKTLAPDDPDLAWSLGDMGVLLRDRGDYVQAESYLLRALAIFERHKQGYGVAWTENDLGILNRRRRSFASAEDHFRRAVVAFEQSVGDSHPDLAKCLYEYSGLLGQVGRFADAEQLARRAAGIRMAAGRPSAKL